MRGLSGLARRAWGGVRAAGSVTPVRAVPHAWAVPAGTVEDPVPISSAGDRRVVACSGSRGGGHDIAWITVERGTLGQCPCCWQVFRLEEKR